MGSIEMGAKGIEMYEVGPCEDAYKMGFLIGQRFSRQIRSRLSTDTLLQKHLLPFAKTLKGQQLRDALSESNKKKFPNYWDELLGTAEGSGVPFHDILLLNFRKEIVPFIPNANEISKEYDNINEDCSDILVRIRTSEASIGHNYNLIDITTRRILNVETASRNRISVIEIGATPFFHANMYLHLQQVQQVQNENSLNRQKRAALLPKRSKSEFLSLLGDMTDRMYPIYMTGPVLHTLCTTVIDLDDQTLSIIEGNPKNGESILCFQNVLY